MILIKRYNNRKMYNTTTRQYVTLDEIAELMQSGQEVQVIDHPSGEDITTAILTQILAQQEKQINGGVPLVLLARLVQLSGATLNAMKDSIQAFLDPIAYVSREIQRRLSVLVEQGKLTPRERERLEPLLTSSDLAPSLVKTDDEEPAATVEDLQRLINQIDALEARLAAMDEFRD